MKATKCVMLVQLLIFSILNLKPVQCYDPEALDYMLHALEFWSSVHSGVFSCVFYNFAPKHSYGNILDDVLKSPRLNHIVKYVVNGSLDEILNLPREPSLLVLHLGNDTQQLLENRLYVIIFLFTFKPTTEVVAFIDDSNPEMEKFTEAFLLYRVFAYWVMVASEQFQILSCNGVYYRVWETAPRLIELFTYGRRFLRGRNITYVDNTYYPLPWVNRWLNESARYLSTEVVEFQHDCNGTGDRYLDCLDKLDENRTKLDIFLIAIWARNTSFGAVCTSIPLFMKIAVPRDRPFNVAEILAMPFSWQVWTLLTVTLISSEVVRHLFPNLFKNDPILLAVCGFERHDLHRAGHWEKIFFFSLIVLMFFMTNAFESKIISLMTKKPSIQRVKTLEDLHRSDIKFYDDLENNPHYTNLSVVGRMMVQGENPQFGEAIPGVGAIWRSELVELFVDMAFDYDRMQPFYVVLDYTYTMGPECYTTGMRFAWTDVFGYVHITLVEAGLVELWKRQWRAEMKAKYVGVRPRVDIGKRVHLGFNDIRPAWIVLVVGLSASLVGFLVENLVERLHTWWFRKSSKVK